MSGVNGSASRRQLPFQYIHSDDENSEQMRSERSRERCEDEEVLVPHCLEPSIYVCHAIILYVQEMPGVQLRKRRGIKRKVNVYESEDDDYELTSEHKPKLDSSRRLLCALESDDDTQ